MGTFSDRFNNQGDSRPECYGDPDYFDLSDRTCQDCRWKGTCRLKVSALKGTQSAPYERTTAATPQGQVHRPVVKAKVYEDPVETDTFTSVLMHNAGLNAVTSISETLTDALSQIPRKKYPGLRKRTT